MEIKPGHLEALHSTLKQLEKRWVPPTPDASVWYAYDPLPVALFYAGINAIESAAVVKTFLDIGCGIGTKLSLMHYAGYEVSGIDQYEPYLEIAQELVPEASLKFADALDLDEFDADVVYMYRLAVQESVEIEVEDHVIDHMKTGSYLFLPGRHIEDDLLEKVADNVWVKK